MSATTPQRDFKLKGVVWIVYNLTFTMLSFLEFVVFLSSRGNIFFANVSPGSRELEAGDWYLAALTLTMLCFFISWFIKTSRTRWQLTVVYSLGIVVTLILFPITILHADPAGFFNLYTPIPWFLVWVSIAMMGIFVVAQNRKSSSRKALGSPSVKPSK